MNRDTYAYNVYVNLAKCLEHRGGVLQSVALDAGQFGNAINGVGFAAHSGNDSVFAVLAPGSKVLNKKETIGKFMTDVLRDKTTIRNVLIAFDGEIKPKMTANLESFRAARGLSGLLIELYGYQVFATDAPHHKSVPVHAIASDVEIAEYCSAHYTTKQSFSKILSTDPQAVWLGARPGSCVRIERFSETVGIAIVYRLVV